MGKRFQYFRLFPPFCMILTHAVYHSFVLYFLLIYLYMCLLLLSYCNIFVYVYWLCCSARSWLLVRPSLSLYLSRSFSINLNRRLGHHVFINVTSTSKLGPSITTLGFPNYRLHLTKLFNHRPSLNSTEISLRPLLSYLYHRTNRFVPRSAFRFSPGQSFSWRQLSPWSCNFHPFQHP